RLHYGPVVDEARALGARRFETQGLATQAELHLAEGDLATARDLLLKALAISREIGPTFAGPLVLGNLARATADPAEGRGSLAEGEAVLNAGALSHNYFYFYRAAIEASLAAGDFAAADRYADAFAAVDRTTPIPRAKVLAARGQALAAFGRGQ